MAKDCLKVQYKKSFNNDSLMELDVFQFNVKAAAFSSNHVIVVNKVSGADNLTATIVNGYFCDSSGNNQVSTKIITGYTNLYVYNPDGDATIKISSAKNLLYVSHDSHVELDLDMMQYLQAWNVSIAKGELGEYGDIGYLADLANLKEYSDNEKMYGDISVLNNKSLLEKANFRVNKNMYGVFNPISTALKEFYYYNTYNPIDLAFLANQTGIQRITVNDCCVIKTNWLTNKTSLLTARFANAVAEGSIANLGADIALTSIDFFNCGNGLTGSIESLCEAMCVNRESGNCGIAVEYTGVTFHNNPVTAHLTLAFSSTGVAVKNQAGTTTLATYVKSSGTWTYA